MTDRHRALLALHGGVLILIALLLGLLAVTDSPASGLRNWQSAHQTLLLLGAWQLATAGAGVTGFNPGGSAAEWVAFVSNAVVMLTSVLAALLTISGAWNALRPSRDSSAG